ncbi:prohead core scaffolding protein and protease [uncultured Caudovirales phage]|uniref:Prohead core scaffolding protein and protease n=1 Tax=uncultured Caudovirales phage TaxID=2100421 RepID=A0A6J5NYU1_9CAUD|nr:prohead core scaffolding protein and protease [uncultured Caudovirales phage]
MKLFTELVEDVQYITEAKENGKKEYFIEGIFLQANIKNRNGRMYPIDVLEKEVSRYKAEVIENKRAFGELGHPSGPSINLDRVSHIITELYRKGSNFIGKAKITETPMGQIARGIMESGGQLGVSSRAMGSLKEEKGVMVVQNDLRLSTAADIVADPSAPDAFVKGIMENVEWIYDPVKGTWHEEKLYETKKIIKRMTISELEEKRLAIFEDYVASLAIKNKIL